MEKYREVYRYVQQGESSFRTLRIRERESQREGGGGDPLRRVIRSELS